MKTLGIVGALHEEIAPLLQAMQGASVHRRLGQRDYWQGVLHGRPCVLVLARVGKVAAAATTVTLIHEFKVDEVIFVGVAGAVAPQVRVGDIVVAERLMQHDLDASPLFPRFEVPLLGRSRFEADARLSAALRDSARAFLDTGLAQQITSQTRQEFGLEKPRLHQGCIVSGDCFINDSTGVQALRHALPDALCVEMEGAAVAQVCHEYGIPFAVLRTISDAADEGAAPDFSAFLMRVARFYSAGVLARFLALAP